MDDVIIFGFTFEKALHNLGLVFERFRQANLKLKPSKCSLFQHEVLFLGHLVSADGISCDPSKIEAVKNWPVPQNVSAVRSFLGLVGYYRKYLDQFTEYSSILTDLTKKNRKFVWNEKCNLAFENLKQKLISAPILAFPKTEGEE